jgi:hypothetical protein
LTLCFILYLFDFFIILHIFNWIGLDWPSCEEWIWHGIPETIKIADESGFPCLQRDNMKISIIVDGEGETLARCGDTVSLFLFFLHFLLFFSVQSLLYIFSPFKVLAYVYFAPLAVPLVNIAGLSEDHFLKEFEIGAGYASNCFDKGIEGMKVGSKLIIRIFEYVLHFFYTLFIWIVSIFEILFHFLFFLDMETRMWASANRKWMNVPRSQMCLLKLLPLIQFVPSISNDIPHSIWNSHFHVCFRDSFINYSVFVV